MTIMRTCCNDPRWLRWKVVDADGIRVLTYTLTRAGARRWLRRHERGVIV